MPWATILFFAAIFAGIYLLKRGRLDRVSQPIYIGAVIAWAVVGFVETLGVIMMFSSVGAPFPFVFLVFVAASVAAWWAVGVALIKKRREDVRRELALRRAGVKRS